MGGGGGGYPSVTMLRGTSFKIPLYRKSANSLCESYKNCAASSSLIYGGKYMVYGSDTSALVKIPVLVAILVVVSMISPGMVATKAYS